MNPLVIPTLITLATGGILLASRSKAPAPAPPPPPGPDPNIPAMCQASPDLLSHVQDVIVLAGQGQGDPAGLEDLARQMDLAGCGTVGDQLRQAAGLLRTNPKPQPGPQPEPGCTASADLNNQARDTFLLALAPLTRATVNPVKVRQLAGQFLAANCPVQAASLRSLADILERERGFPLPIQAVQPGQVPADLDARVQFLLNPSLAPSVLLPQVNAALAELARLPHSGKVAGYEAALEQVRQKLQAGPPPK